LALLAIGVALVVPFVTKASEPATSELVIYTSQKDFIMQPVVDAFVKETGVPTRVVFDQAGPLLERLRAEGDKSPADVLIAVDAGNLVLAAQQGLLTPVAPTKATRTWMDRVPAHLRDPDRRWFGFSQRVRSIVYNPDLVKAAELSTYEDLGNPKWKGRLCVRSSGHVYNQSLVALTIEQRGEDFAERLVKGWVANLAQPPFANDTQLIQAIAEGKCHLGISNHYYLARLLAEKPDLKARMFWADQRKGDGGVHVNILGGGLTASVDQRENALRFLEWMTSVKTQNLLARANFEFPVVRGVEVHELVRGWGSFRPMQTNLRFAGQRQREAVKLFDRSQYL
jgi:iron(III) transport system substrate-binding protein